MKRWSWIGVVLVVAILGVVYALVAKRQSAVSDDSAGDLGVEDYETPPAEGLDAGYTDAEDPALEQVEDVQAPPPRPKAPAASAPIETIEDESEAGETVQGPTVVDDEDVNVEVQPAAKP